MVVSIAKKQLREFGFLIGVGFPILIGWIMPAIGGHAFRGWTLWIAILFLITGILKPSLLFYPLKGWMALGLALGWINSRLILGLVFLEHLLMQDSGQQSGLLQFPWLLEFEVEQLLLSDLAIFSIEA